MTGCCYHCENRKVGCHSDCEKYKLWVDDYHAKQKAIKEEKERFYAGVRRPKIIFDKTRR